ncbi:MAG: hypothetical protein H6627_00550 [Calditrichae bacterium]|nr:hypothetical protein [Calditrichota bacterium]MCB9057026.1 hypothetical protein [Calditrichia bacterium]
MRYSVKIRQLLFAVFIFGMLLFNQPILGIFNNGTIAGIPNLLFYIFLIWGIIILVMALITLINPTKTKKN